MKTTMDRTQMDRTYYPAQLKAIVALIDKADIWNELYIIGEDFDEFSKENPTDQEKENIAAEIFVFMTVEEVEFCIEEM